MPISRDDLVKKHWILQGEKIDPYKAKRPFYAFEAWGIECSDGWNDLLDQLCEKIEIELDNAPELKKYFKVNQVKEKFGGLRFYVSGANEKILSTIDLFEELSYNICERCGNEAKCRKIDGWIYTLCDSCCSKKL